MSVVYINEQGAYLRKRGGRFVVTKSDEEIFSIPEAAIDEIVLLGNVQVSTQAMSELLANGVELLFLSRNGKFKGVLEAGFSKNVFSRIAQYDASINEEACLSFARHIVSEKIQSEINTLDRWCGNGLIDSPTVLKSELRLRLASLRGKTDNAELRGVEGMAAKLYFSVFSDVVPAPFEWSGRNRRPPKDPVNALLSLTYMMTLSQIISKIYAHGFDPFIGFLHELEYSRPSFALDILELLRSPYCDRFTIFLLQSEILYLEDFYYDEKNGCRLSNDGFKKYLAEFDQFANKRKTNQLSLNKRIAAILLEFAEMLKNRR